MAQGEVITHANRKAVNTNLLADLADEIGAPAKLCEEIRAAETARFAAEKLEEIGLADQFYQALAKRTIATLKERYPSEFSVRVLVCDFSSNPLADVSSDGVKHD
jgi:cobalt-precorrin-5B (C1)-methyltransferase